MSSQRYDRGVRLSKVDATPQGGLSAPAYLTRAGVFDYVYPDGRKVRELRHPDEVFAAPSLATLPGATLTLGHPGMVTPQNYKEHNIGSVADDVRRDGKFVAATVRVQDGTAVEGVRSGDLVELSCGYTADVVFEAGVYDGEPFDARQTNIRYNHVGIGGHNWGRAGTEVGLKLDCAYSQITMPDPVITPAPAVPAQSPINVVQVADYERVSGENAAHKSTIADLTAKLDAATKALEAATSPAAIDKLVTARVKLVTDAKALAGDKLVTDGRTAIEIMTDAVAVVSPGLKLDGKTDGYIEGAFWAKVDQAAEVSASKASLNKATTEVDPTTARADGTDPSVDPVAAAKARMNTRLTNAYKAKVS